MLMTTVATAVLGEAPDCDDRRWPGKLGFVLAARENEIKALGFLGSFIELILLCW
jgi:hypothetical protein